MNLELTEDQKMLRESFAKLLDEHSSMLRVRASQKDGIDRELWQQLAELGTFCMRVPESHDGLGLGTFEAAMLMEEVGRTLATGPIAETLLVARLLALLGETDALDKVIGGECIATLALHPANIKASPWLAGGAVADMVVAQRGNDIVLYELTDSDRCLEPTLADNGLGQIHFSKLTGRVIASGENGVNLYTQIVEEWKLLMAATMTGLSREALRLASEYACERKQFGVPIGTFQAISHPLADILTHTDGGHLLNWKVIHDLSRLNHSDKPSVNKVSALISLNCWWTIETAGRAVEQALHTFGGYGLTTEYDIHLYNLRAKALPLVFGDPKRLLEEGAKRRFGHVPVTVPDVGDVSIHYDLGEEATRIAEELDAFFTRHLTPALKEKAHYSWDGHDAGIHRQLAQSGLLFPAWPVEFGGRGASPYAQNAIAKVWEKHGWGSHAANTTSLVGLMIHRYGSDTLKRDVLAKIASGEVICSLGYSEPASGSDVFAAQCRATPDGDEWIIEGTKMFTSGANIADYVIMLTRTNTQVPRHKGLSMFIVPLKTPGVSVQPVYTFQNERTNITFYDGVRIPDAYRLGEVDAGVKVMAAGLELEHGGGFSRHQFQLAEAAEQLCRDIIEDDIALMDTLDAQVRVSKALLHAEMAELIENRALWASEHKLSNQAYGPMAKLFSSEMFQHDATDLLALTAPDSLSKRAGPAGFLNQCYKHAQGTTIYGGTSEIHRSQIAERALGLPRTRG